MPKILGIVVGWVNKFMKKIVYIQINTIQNSSKKKTCKENRLFSLQVLIIYLASIYSAIIQSGIASPLR